MTPTTTGGHSRPRRAYDVAVTQVLVLPYPPSVNHIYKRGKKGVYLTDAALSFKAQVGWRCLEARIEPLRGPVALTIDVYRPRKVGDIDNGAKLILDSLQGYAYLNDKQVTELTIRRHEDKKNPRVEVRCAGCN